MEPRAKMMRAWAGYLDLLRARKRESEQALAA
jgi:hypothetical protein